MSVKAEEVRMRLQNGETLIRTEEGIYFLQVGDAPPLLEDPAEAADALLNELLSTQAERDAYKRGWQGLLNRSSQLDKQVVIESCTRIEKDMEDDCNRFLAEIERLKAENVRVVALAGAGYEKLVEALRSAEQVLGSMPMNDARLWGVYTKLADTLKDLGLGDDWDASRAERLSTRRGYMMKRQWLM